MTAPERFVVDHDGAVGRVERELPNGWQMRAAPSGGRARLVSRQRGFGPFNTFYEAQRVANRVKGAIGERRRRDAVTAAWFQMRLDSIRVGVK